MTSRQLVDFLEAKLRQHGIEKVIPEQQQTLATAYRMFVDSDRLSDDRRWIPSVTRTPAHSRK